MRKSKVKGQRSKGRSGDPRAERAIAEVSTFDFYFLTFAFWFAYVPLEVGLPITIRIPPPLRRFTRGDEVVETAAGNLAELFEGLEQKHPGIKQALCARDGTPLRFVNIYVNDEDIRFLGGPQYAFRDGDEVLLIPAIAGGKSLSYT
jgi:molybdopterin synthase sulfur carrier subunit